jgi:DNA-binding FrmR family transcriptional regulator
MLKSKSLKRYQIALGHLKKVISMLEENRYCLDVIHQSIAVQAALRSADRVVMENHLKTCVSDSIKAGHADESIKEIMGVLEKL